MSIISMIKNGYRPDGRGNYGKVHSFPRNDGSGNSHYVERIVRDKFGRMVKIQSAKKHLQRARGC